MRIITVLRSKNLQGGPSEFKPLHVQALKRQLEKHAPFVQFECLSDVDVPGVETIPLEHKWPGWWAKMEAMSPRMKGDFILMDLDTVITGSLDDIEHVTKLTMLRDFYRDGKKLKEGIANGVCFMPEADRARVWDLFVNNPAFNMRLYARGDMFLFERLFLNTAQRWQDVVPGQIVSWKVHCAKTNTVPPDARIVCGHGHPRPWAVPQLAHLYR